MVFGFLFSDFGNRFSVSLNVFVLLRFFGFRFSVFVFNFTCLVLLFTNLFEFSRLKSLTAFSERACSVDITHFSVPKFVDRKDEVTLECHFVMSSPQERLHSVKWYRIDHTGAMEDFFTYMEGRNPPVKTYPRAGIKVDVRKHIYHRDVRKCKKLIFKDICISANRCTYL